MATKKGAVVKYDAAQYPVAHEKGLGTIQSLVAQLGPGQQFQLTRLKVPSGGGTTWEFETLTGGESVKTLDVVFGLMLGHQKSWYRTSYEDSGGGSPPDCSSSDGVTGIGNNTMNADAEPGVFKCSECPHNTWGSAEQGDGKACTDWAMGFIFRPGSRLPMLLQIPTTSVKPMSKYLMQLLDAGYDITEVVTRLELEPDKNKRGQKFSRIKPSMLVALPEEEAKRMDAIKSELLGFAGTARMEVDPREPAAASA